MRFLSFSNKTKLRQKDLNPELRAFGLAHRRDARNASKFAIFFSAFSSRVVIWAVRKTTLIFFVQKAVARLAIKRNTSKNCRRSFNHTIAVMVTKRDFSEKWKQRCV
jgi:hypothetical protein